MRSMLLLAALALGSGCVSKVKYNALDTRYTQSQDEITRLKQELARRDALAQLRMQQFRELVTDFRPLVDRGVLQIEVVDGRVVLAMAADVLFSSGSAALSDAGKENLKEVARVLSRRPEYEFQVEGHTDDAAINTPQFPNNWYLGSARAIEVVQFLVANGMSAESLSAASFGQWAPVTGNNTPENMARNRRIELVLLPDLGELPGYQLLMEQTERPVRRRRPARGGMDRRSETPPEGQPQAPAGGPK